MKKLLAVGVIVLFISVSVIPSTGTTDVKQITMPISNGNTLYVGGNGTGNYTKIQDAINDASDGDTVFVYNRGYEYVENLIVNKSINLIGEDRETTVINGFKSRAIKVITDKVNISGFTLEGRVGIVLSESSYCNVSRNIISTTYYQLCWPIELHESHYNIISENDISNNDRIEYSAVFVGYSHYNIISGNNITNNDGYGILLVDSLNNTISGNNISNNDDGIYYYDPIGIYTDSYSLRSIISDNIICSNGCGIIISGICNAICDISGNDISNNWYGIFCDGLQKNKITDNIISNNKEGICLMASGNIIERNNIANNQLGINICSGYNRVFKPNIVKENNFIENERSVSYDCFTNRWIRNYWDDWGSPSPRPIKDDCTFWGLSILLDIILDKDIDISIPWVQYDWHPAQEPYDIGV